MGALLKAPVSTGFVSRRLVRLDAALITACIRRTRSKTRCGRRTCSAPTKPPPRSPPRPARKIAGTRTSTRCGPCGPIPAAGDLIWYGAAGNRTKASITSFGILDGYRGALVRDDYGGYLSYDAGLTGVQQCLAHLYRYLDDAYATDPESQVWNRQARRPPWSAPVRTARDAREASLDPALLAGLRHHYDQAVACGISVNLSRRWHKGNHPGLILARRLKRKAAQVWLFATRFDVPATNNGSENAVRGYKLAAKISGCWRTLSTLQRHCRIRSRLTTARSDGPAHPARRHPRRPHRKHLDATAPSMIN